MYEDLEPQPLNVGVWQVMPVHYPATCRFDKVCLEIIETLQPTGACGGSLVEFSNPKFPRVAALLNPQHYSRNYPLTIAVVSNIIYVMTLESLPEQVCVIATLKVYVNSLQVALMYIICSLFRWIITGNKEDYYLMPGWLQLTASQIVTAHSTWIDYWPWPKARVLLCRHSHHHDKFEEMNNAYNKTMSVNWPYEAADTLVRVSPTEHSVNPVFISHIRNLGNWTLGPGFLERYPDFTGQINIGRPRAVRIR